MVLESLSGQQLALESVWAGAVLRLALALGLASVSLVLRTGLESESAGLALPSALVPAGLGSASKMELPWELEPAVLVSASKVQLPWALDSAESASGLEMELTWALGSPERAWGSAMGLGPRR